MIVVVSDNFSDKFIGGAELTTEALLSCGFKNYKRIESKKLTVEDVKKLRQYKWIFGNFSEVAKETLLEIIKNVSDYSILEYDYKYCRMRLESLHIAATGSCDCTTSRHGKLVALFYAKSKNVFFMSQKQREQYFNKFHFLKKAETHVLSSIFSDETLQYISSLNTKNKNNKYIILESGSWVKGYDNNIRYAKDRNLEYETVSGLSHKELLKKLAAARGLIFLPNGFATCPRLTIEAKLLDCELILNENVQHKDEEWFDTKEGILSHLEERKQFFRKKCLDIDLTKKNLPENNKFHFIIPGYNASKWLSQCLETIIRQDYNKYTVTYIDDMSTDVSVKIFNQVAHTRDNFRLIKNSDRKYALNNIYNAISKLDAAPNDIIILLDADDWLANKSVLSYLNEVYDDKQTLATYGSYMYYPFGDKGVEPSEYSGEVQEKCLYRKDHWRASHLRTFRKKVWDKIDVSDLKDKNGKFYQVAYDQAIMLPILEMCRERVKYIDKILLVYNRKNPLNVDKRRATEQHTTAKQIRAKKPYERYEF